MNNVYLLLGGNMGQREVFLQKAAAEIELAFGAVIKRSGVYQTPAWGKTDEPDYLNQVLLIQTDKPARQVLETILAIEQKLGRKRMEKWGSRIIDIDILFYGDEVIHDFNLVVPHPELYKRSFTLIPLAEIAPNLVHPVFKKNILQLKQELKDNLIVKKHIFE